jgi:hypothetical protein
MTHGQRATHTYRTTIVTIVETNHVCTYGWRNHFIHSFPGLVTVKYGSRLNLNNISTMVYSGHVLLLEPSRVKRLYIGRLGHLLSPLNTYPKNTRGFRV